MRYFYLPIYDMLITAEPTPLGSGYWIDWSKKEGSYVPADTNFEKLGYIELGTPNE